MYLDGLPGWDNVFDPNIPNIEDDTVRIGDSLNNEYPYVSGNFVGGIDDVRIYDYSLSYEEVCYLSNGGLPCYQPVKSPANLVPKDPPGAPFNPNNLDIINFKDFAVLAGKWLQESLWP